jgi:hypothetical protein
VEDISIYSTIAEQRIYKKLFNSNDPLEDGDADGDFPRVLTTTVCVPLPKSVLAQVNPHSAVDAGMYPSCVTVSFP